MPETNPRKRSAAGDGGNKHGKKKGRFFDAKFKSHQTLTGIESGTQGVFATCVRGKERGCVGELYDLFAKYTEKLYGPFEDAEGVVEDEEGEGGMDIEAMMAKELEGMKNTGKGRRAVKPTTTTTTTTTTATGDVDDNNGDEKGEVGNDGNVSEEKMFISVRLDTPCIVYFRTNAPISPCDFVHAICSDYASSGAKQSRWTSRLTPIEQTGKATLEGIESIAKQVLKPHFHEGQTGVKFAIRPTLRNHDVLSRTEIINTVAKCVGLQHKVDLKNYDVLILVEVYKNMCGMSVVRDWEKLKRFNLAQLQEETVVHGTTEKAKADIKVSARGSNKTEAQTESVETTTSQTESKDQQENPGELALFSTPIEPQIRKDDVGEAVGEIAGTDGSLNLD